MVSHDLPFVVPNGAHELFGASPMVSGVRLAPVHRREDFDDPPLGVLVVAVHIERPTRLAPSLKRAIAACLLNHVVHADEYDGVFKAVQDGGLKLRFDHSIQPPHA